MNFYAKEDIKAGQLLTANLTTGLVSVYRPPKATISREAYEELEGWLNAWPQTPFTIQALKDKLRDMLPDETRGEGE